MSRSLRLGTRVHDSLHALMTNSVEGVLDIVINRAYTPEAYEEAAEGTMVALWVLQLDSIVDSASKSELSRFNTKQSE